MPLETGSWPDRCREAVSFSRTRLINHTSSKTSLAHEIRLYCTVFRVFVYWRGLGPTPHTALLRNYIELCCRCSHAVISLLFFYLCLYNTEWDIMTLNHELLMTLIKAVVTYFKIWLNMCQKGLRSASDISVPELCIKLWASDCKAGALTPASPLLVRKVTWDTKFKGCLI